MRLEIAVALLAATLSAAGCGSKSAPGSPQDISARVQGDEVLSKAEAYLKSGNYSGAIGLLDSYKVDSIPKIEARAHLLGTAKLEAGLKELKEEMGSKRLTDNYCGARLEGIARAIDLIIGHLPPEKIVEIYLNSGWIVHHGKTKPKFRKTETPRDTILTLYSSLYDRDDESIARVEKEGKDFVGCFMELSKLGIEPYKHYLGKEFVILDVNDNSIRAVSKHGDEWNLGRYRVINGKTKWAGY